MASLHYYDLLSIPDFPNILLNQDYSNDTLNVIEYSNKTNEVYKIVRYNKDLIDKDTISSFGLVRSVVINKNNHVISVSPSKSLTFEEFFKKYPDKNEHIIGEQFVEGTMINLFWDHSIESWEIATRNTVGANVSFYKNKNDNNDENSNYKTFNQMFHEACLYNSLDVNSLDKKYCYSFVLQHPENRIVVPFKFPQLFLIEVYHIENTPENIFVYTQCLSNINIFGFENSSVQLPEIYEYEKYQDLIDKYASNNSPYNTLGIVFKNILTGERTKKRNPVYQQIKELKGNHPKILYRYLTLRKEGKVREYLEYFPEDKNECNKLRQQLHDFTNTLFSNYKDCYVKKQKPLTEFPPQYRNHMFSIHQIYRNELLEQKLFITNRIVIDYVNKLHPSQQMYALNYNMRKRINDFLQTDDELNSVM